MESSRFCPGGANPRAPCRCLSGWGPNLPGAGVGRPGGATGRRDFTSRPPRPARSSRRLGCPGRKPAPAGHRPGRAPFSLDNRRPLNRPGGLCWPVPSVHRGKRIPAMSPHEGRGRFASDRVSMMGSPVGSPSCRSPTGNGRGGASGSCCQSRSPRGPGGPPAVVCAGSGSGLDRQRGFRRVGVAAGVDRAGLDPVPRAGVGGAECVGESRGSSPGGVEGRLDPHQ